MNRRFMQAISIGFFVLSAAMLICAIISARMCHTSIAAQLAQGATVQGNELTIINIYLSACAQYVAYAALLFFCGWLPRTMFKKVSTQMPATTELPVSAESDEDFLKRASGEPAQRE